MNRFQRFLARLRRAWAAFHAGELRPPRMVDPARPIADVVNEWRERGRQDEPQFDAWTFGGPEIAEDEIVDPPGVQQVRREGVLAVRQFRIDQDQTTAALGSLGHVIAESDRLLRSARRRISRAAARQVRREDLVLDRAAAMAEARAAALQEWNEQEAERAAQGTRAAWPPEYLRRRSFIRTQMRVARAEQAAAAARALLDVPDDPGPEHDVWEGPTPLLGAWWRAFLLVLFTLLAGPLSLVVASAYLPEVTIAVGGTTLQRDQVLLATAAVIAAGVVLAHYVLGSLYRARETTGYPRLLAVVSQVTLLVVPGVAVSFGTFAAQLIASGRVGDVIGQDRIGNLSATTLRVVTVALAVLPTFMAFLVGLARPHPYQAAYLRNRRRRHRLFDRGMAAGRATNPAYLGPGREREGHEEEAAIREIYHAAEEAYLAGVAEEAENPYLTEAIARRRGKRPYVPPFNGALGESGRHGAASSPTASVDPIADERDDEEPPA